MNYEEKIIDGILCWRSRPDAEWKACTLEALSARVIELEKRIAAAIRQLQG